ncbi:MAG TPA: DUF177 domain-containing protein [Chitinophagales bacterium]
MKNKIFRAVKVLREYQIPYVGLKIGNHTFHYEVDDKFFKAFEGSLIEKCDVKVRIELEKKETLFILNFFIDGSVNVICDRCSESFDKEIFGDFQCLVKYRGERDENLPEDEDEILFINREDSFIDVSELIYDYINLCLPMQLIHADNTDGTSGCNPEVLKYLQGQETKSETQENDPRWLALKNFKSDN